MGMFDQEIPGYVSGPQRIRRAGQELGNQLAPGIKRMTGYESPKRKAMAIAGKADLSSMPSIQGTYQELQQINPTAATAWLKDAMASFNGETQRKATSAKGATKVQFQKAGVPGDPTKTMLLSNKSGKMEPVLNAQGQPYVENKYQAQSMQGTLPQGYRMSPDGSLEVIPGSPTEAKIAAAEVQNKAKAEGTMRSSKLVNNTINRLQKVIKGAKDNSVDNVFGITGAVGEWIPSSDRNNAETLVSTIKSHIGFDRLDRMRKESPTGGALGQVSEMELRQLNATLGSLEFSQTEEQFLVTLKQVQDEYDYIMRKIAKTGDGTYVPPAVNNNNPLGI
jgi:hypothetical protein